MIGEALELAHIIVKTIWEMIGNGVVRAQQVSQSAQQPWLNFRPIRAWIKSALIDCHKQIKAEIDLATEVAMVRAFRVQTG